ncbi:porin [Pandoraea sp. NPDC087047]|uniref:porin n=1 Tax=Pandoraea sp. NPDC087047 TaxID=3364390 RepID=UPI0037FCAB44
MKKMACAGLLLSALSAGAHAQSGVTLYGLISSGVSYISNTNGSSAVKLDSGVNQVNRFGLRGTEDLGGGLRAVFNLESGFDLGSGKLNNGGALFGRRANVGLSSDTYGTLTLGRDYDFIYDYVSFYTNVAQFAPSYSFHLSYDIDRYAGEPMSNTIKYQSPKIGGVSVGLMYGFSNVPGQFAGAPGNPRFYSAGFSYDPGRGAPFTFAGAFTKTDGLGGTLAQIVLNAPTIETAAFGARAVFGAASVNANYSYTNATTVTGAAIITRIYEAGFLYQFTPAFSTGVGYTFIDQNIGKYHMVSAGADYRFTKRTDVYLMGTWQHAFAGAKQAGNFVVVTPGTTNGYSSTPNQLAVQLGIRHLF